MGDLEKALTDIKAVRKQIARGTEFRGYGAAAFAATAVLALAAAMAQSHWIDNPQNDVLSYLALWVSTAILSVALIGIDVITRSRRVHSGLSDAMVQSAAEQLLPAMVAGALLTAVTYHFSPQSLWMLPGLWQIVLSLGVFASCRSLPAPFVAVGIWYLGSGLLCVAFGGGEFALSPWAMGIPFAVGQFLGAALIYLVGARDAE